MQAQRSFHLHGPRLQPHPFSFSFSTAPNPITKSTKQLSITAIASDVTLTVSDAEFESRGFTVHRTSANLDVDALNDVFALVGFPRRETSRLKRALEHGDVVWVGQADRVGRPIAFARAAGDGVFNAVVWDVVVDPSYQGLGFGKAVMERLVAELRRQGVGNIALYAEPRVVGFYRPLGFAADPDGIRGMVYSRKNQQKKR